MPETPVSVQQGAVVTFVIKVNGTSIPDTFSVLSVNVERSVNRIPSAKIVVLDGSPDTGKFDASSSNVFVPGNLLSIEAGYDNTNQMIFKGIITAQSIKIDSIVGSTLEILCRDEAVRMTIGRKCSTFPNQKDSDIFSGIIGSYPGLSGKVSPTNTKWPVMVQHYATDWDFILSRAEVNGLIVTTLNGLVSVTPPDADTSPVLALKYGDNLMEFNAEVNAVTQLGSVTASSWGYDNQSLNTADAVNNVAGPGNLSSKTLSAVAGPANYELQSTAPLGAPELTDWAAAQMVKSEYSKIQGNAKFQGTGLVYPGKFITLQGLGNRFNGDHLVSSVTHTIADGNWITEVSIGLAPNWFITEPDVIAPPASGLLPAAAGLFNGIVKQLYGDPDGQCRILVDMPLFDKSGTGVWARVANFYATKDAGAFFLPEVGDEVVVSFLNEDPRFPIVLGSMYSSTNPPANNATENNAIKSITSKSGLSIEFNDEKKILTIKTPGNQLLTLNDDNATLAMADSNGNSITMSADGIAIKSSKSIAIESGEKVSINSNTGIEIAAPSGDITTKAMNIKAQADMEFNAEGNASTKITASGELILKGAMIMIN